MYDCFVSLYWPEMHGKCDADQLFGLLEQLMATHPLFSIDELMALALKILWRGRKTESHIISAEALTEWAPYFKAQDETPFHSSVRHHAYAYPMACSSGPRGLRTRAFFSRQANNPTLHPMTGAFRRAKPALVGLLWCAPHYQGAGIGCAARGLAARHLHQALQGPRLPLHAALGR
eukprot:scaffold71070_cov68-Phaeocystis_antarctica.AAC.6